MTARSWLAAVGFALVAGNAVVAAHAWRFTHYAAGVERTGQPLDLGLLARAQVLLTGVVVPRPAIGRVPADIGLSARSSIDAVGGGGQLATWTIPGSGVGTVLLFHGYAASRSDLLDEAGAFHAAGWTTVLADFPGSGESEGNTTTLGWTEAEVVARLAAAHHDGRLVLFGKSMGSVAILRAVGELGTQADALVVENPYDRLTTTVEHRFEAMGLPGQPGASLLVFWGGIEMGFRGASLNPVDFARHVTVPTLLLHGSKDERVHLDEVESIADALAGPHDIVVFTGAGHVGLRASNPRLWDGAVMEFLSR